MNIKFYLTLISLIVLVGAMPLMAQLTGSYPAVDVQKLTDHLYQLKAAASPTNVANVVASVGTDGVLIVDTGYPNAAPLLQQEIKKLGNGQLKMIINTHYHRDHVGGNQVLGPGVTIIAHENTRKRMTSGINMLNETPPAALPTITVTSESTIHFNGETIRLIPLLDGHTDSDLLVHFVEANIVHAGDQLVAASFPYIDYNAGGHLQTYFDNLRKLTTMFPAGTLFVGGHGPVYSNDDIKKYIVVMEETINAVRLELAAGRTVDEIKKKNILKPWVSWDIGLVSANLWIDLITTGLNPETSRPRTAIVEPLCRTLLTGDVQAAIAQYYELKKSRPHDYDFSEFQLNALGYYLLQRNRIADAIANFKLNVAAFPDAFNVYDSLGEAYMNAGERSLAIDSYKKSLALNPDNQNAVDKLKQLETSP